MILRLPRRTTCAYSTRGSNGVVILKTSPNQPTLSPSCLLTTGFAIPPCIFGAVLRGHRQPLCLHVREVLRDATLQYRGHESKEKAHVGQRLQARHSWEDAPLTSQTCWRVLQFCVRSGASCWARAVRSQSSTVQLAPLRCYESSVPLSAGGDLQPSFLYMSLISKRMCLLRLPPLHLAVSLLLPCKTACSEAKANTGGQQTRGCQREFFFFRVTFGLFVLVTRTVGWEKKPCTTRAMNSSENWETSCRSKVFLVLALWMRTQQGTDASTACGILFFAMIKDASDVATCL